MKLFPSPSRGFTLIETLVAITVLTLAIVGPFQIVQGVLNAAYNSRDQIIAAGLGQEAMEFVREVRDSNYLYTVYNGAGAVGWLSGFDGTNGPDCYTSACVVDPHYYPSSVPFVAGSSVTSCAGATCTNRPLYLNTSTYRYTQQSSGATQTKFTRSVRMTLISAHETLVTVTVTWENHGSHSIILTEYLQDWL